MNRTSLLEQLSQQTTDFIGYGNPDSDILILGKECGFLPADPSADPFHYHLQQISYHKNAESWRAYCKEPYSSESIADWLSTGEGEWEAAFSPRFAFKGQHFEWARPDSESPGTSLTYFRYQQLMDCIRGVSRPHGALLDFQDHCFISELSSVPMKMSNGKTLTQLSIKERTGELFTHAFFRSFPIIISACKGYVFRFGVNLKSLFPDSRIIITNQLSILREKNYIPRIVEWVNSDDKYSIL